MIVGIYYPRSSTVICDSCATVEDYAFVTTKVALVLNPKSDDGVVCDVCDLVLDKRGRWVDVGGN